MRKYVLDIVGDLPVILMEIDPADGSIQKTYIYANSQIIAQHDGHHSAPRYFYLHDRLGSVRQIIDSDADVVRHYTYTPFGEVLESSHEPQATSNSFLFTGQWFDDEIDEYYLRARQYFPHIARFTSRDPVSGEFQEPLTLHRYLYCIDDPVNKIDPFGQDYVDMNVTWTYGIVPGMLHGAVIGSGYGPVGTAIGAGAGAVVGGFGFTGGLMFERNEAHFYLGPSWTNNLAGGPDFTLSVCGSPETTVETGWYVALSGSVSGAYTQWGKHLKSGATFQEFGITSGTSMGYRFGVSLFYAFPGMKIPSFTGTDPRSGFNQLDLLDRAIMMNAMREDTAELLQGGIAGIPMYSTYYVTADILLGM